MKKILGIIATIGIGVLFIIAFLFGQERAIDEKRNSYAAFKGEQLRKNLPGENTVMYNEDTLIYVLYIKDLKDVGNQMHHNIEENVKITQFQEDYIDNMSNSINEGKKEAKEFNEEGFEYVKVEFVLEDGTIINTKRNHIRYTNEND